MQLDKYSIIRDSTKFERAGTYYFSSASAAQSSRNTHRVLGGQGAPAKTCRLEEAPIDASS